MDGCGTKKRRTLQRSLKLDRLEEVSDLSLFLLTVHSDFLTCREGEDILDGFFQDGAVDFAHFRLIDLTLLLKVFVFHTHGQASFEICIVYVSRINRGDFGFFSLSLSL